MVMRGGAGTFLRGGARLAFGAAVVLLPFRWRIELLARPAPPIYGDYTGFLLAASDIAVLLTLAAWGASLPAAPHRLRTGPRAIALPLVLLVAAGALSVPFSVDPALSAYHLVRLLVLGALYLFVVNEIASPRVLVVPVAAQVFVQAAVGIAQVLRQHSLGLASLGEAALDPAWRGVSIVWSGTSLLLRAYGLSDHPNLLGGCLAFALIVLMLAVFEKPERWNGMIAAVFALGALALFLTFSRTAWFAFAAGALCTLALLLRGRARAAAVRGVALLCAAALVVAPFAWAYADYLGVRVNLAEPSMASGENRSVVERDVLNGAAAQIFVAHPLAGVGLGAFPLALRAARPQFPFDYQPPHNVWLAAAAETGVAGALAYLALALAPWLAMWPLVRRGAITPALAVASGVLLATTLAGLLDYYTWLLPAGRLWQWLAWGLWAAAYPSRPGDERA